MFDTLTYLAPCFEGDAHDAMSGVVQMLIAKEKVLMPASMKEENFKRGRKLPEEQYQ